MGDPTSRIRYRQHSSQDRATAQAPTLRQSSDTLGGGGIFIKIVVKICAVTHTHTHARRHSLAVHIHVTKTVPLLHNSLFLYKDPKLATDLTNTLTPSVGSSLSSSYSAGEEFRGFRNLNICFHTQEPANGCFYSP